MAEAPYIEYRVVRTLGSGYDDGLPPERQTFAVVIAFPDHPGWWRVVGEFRSQSRAERYAEVENECRDYRRDDDGDTITAEPENAPAEPEGRISPENFDRQQYRLVADAAEFEASRLTEQLRLAREEIAAGKSINEGLLTRIRSLEAAAPVADSQVDKLREELRKARASALLLVADRAPTKPEPVAETKPVDPLPLQAELGHRAASVLAALEALWDEGVYEVHTKHLTARGIPQGSLTVAFEILGRHGYATIEPGIPGEPRVRRLICRADGTAPMRAPAIEQIEQAEGQEAPAPEPAAPTPPPAASSPPAGCANCGAPMPEHRKGRFCSADCSQEAAREEERTRLATSTPVDDGIQVIPMRHAEDYGPAVPFKAGPLPPAPIAPAPGFNNPFAEKLAALGRK